MKKYLFALMLCFQFSFSQNTDHLNTVLIQLKIKKVKYIRNFLLKKSYRMTRVRVFWLFLNMILMKKIMKVMIIL